MARDPNKPTRMDGILNNIPKILNELTYNRSEFDPRFHPGKTSEYRVQDSIEFRPNVAPTGTLQPVNPITLQDLVGRPFLTSMSDLTAAGGILEGIGDVPLAHPIRLTGGQDYMRENNQLWASGVSPIADLKTAGDELFNLYGQAPVHMPFQMAPTGGDFAHMTGQTMMSWAGRNMPANNRSQLNKKIELAIPDFVGVEDPYSLVQFGQLNDQGRKSLKRMMDKEFRNLGGISLPQARLAVSDQTQLLPNVGGFKNVGLMDLEGGILSGQGNPTYPDAISGSYLGTLDTDVTAMDLNPNRLARAVKKDGTFREGPPGIDYLSTRTSPGRAMQTGIFGGLITQDLVDEQGAKGKKVKAHPLATVMASLATFFGMGYSGEEAEAAVLTGTLENAADIAGKIKKVEKKKGLGEPLTEGDIMSGRGGQTFLTLEQEARARIYDEFRRQISEFDTPLFDTSEAGTVTIGDRGGVEGVSRYTFPEEYQGATTEVGVETPDLIEIKPTDEGAQLFREKILAGKESSKYGAAVEAYDADTYKGMRLFLTDDGSAGYALTPDGDIVSAFSTGQHIGVGPHLIMHGIEQGGKKLDAFDTVLPDMYATMGMRETSRLAFDPTQAPPDWNEAVFGKYQGGRPDVSFMALDPDFATPVSPNMVDDYGEAIDLQNLAVGLLDSPPVRGSDPLSIMPAPQRFFDPDSKAFKPFLQGDFERGGRYLSMGEGQRDVSGMYPDSASISISPDGKPSFQVSGQSATGLPSQKGRQIKSNLFKKSAGWDWTKVPEGFDPNPDKSFSLVSVEDGSKHYYSLGSNYPEGVNLKRYPMSKDEPRLRPTMKGEVSLGNVVGEIEVRGKKHPVYDNVTVQPKAAVTAAAVGTGLLGTSEESEASILGSLSKLGAGRQDLLGMAKKMANEGVDEIDIRSRTGWELGADGQWKTELPNTKTKINIPEIEEGRRYYAGTIADIVDDPELLSQYEKGGRKPTVRNMDGEIEEYGSRGTYGPLGDIEFIVDRNMPADTGYHTEGHFNSNGEWSPEVIVISGKSSPAEQRATVLHELQHAIQDREGFASGGAARNFEKEERIRDAFYDGVGLTPAGSKRLQELEAKSNEVGQGSMSILELYELERLNVEKQIADRFNVDTVGEAGARSPYGMYRGLMGEVEARNVETRDRMSPDFLKQTPLEFSEDVFEPRSQQIFRVGSDDELTNELAFLDLPNFRSDASSLDDDFARMQQNADGGIVNQMMAQNARSQQLAEYGDALKSRREAIKLKDTTRKLLDVDRPGTLQLGTEFVMRGAEDLAKVIVGATGSLFSPDSGFYEKVSGSNSVFGKPSEAYEDVTGAIAAGLEKYVVPELKKAFAWKGGSGLSINDKVDTAVQDVMAAYTSTPQSFQDFVTPRLPYAATLMLSAYGLGLGKGALQGGKRIVGEPGGPGILGRLNPLEGELVMPEGLPNSKPIGLLQ